MDPKSLSFQPQSDPWQLQPELQRLQAVQVEHSERISRIEKRQEDDARMKSVWGGASPFPGVLSGTPQQTPLHQATADAFKNFDEESANLISSLHLDAEEEPRRVGATSRANSVRFDESANQGHWAHTSRHSMDLMRSGGGVPMGERTPSHKSDGRASSVHSVRSAASGRANSLNLDTTYSFGESSRSPLDTPGVAPGLFLLGSVPAIIRCWMNTDFKHNALLYAAVCTGSHRSFISRSLVEKLGFTQQINMSNPEAQTVMLSVFLPEAVPHPTSARSTSLPPQLPSLTVTFTVLLASSLDENEGKGIQIILGSDLLRLHNADILLSTNKLSLFDDDHNKVSIPLVRPEDEATFVGLRTTNGDAPATSGLVTEIPSHNPLINGLGQSSQKSSQKQTLPASHMSRELQTDTHVGPPSTHVNMDVTDSSDDQDSPSVSRSIRFAADTETSIPPRLATPGSAKDDENSRDSTSRTTSSPAIWSNWRQRGPESPQLAGMDYANAGKTRELPQRKESGMKVLRPTRTTSRTFSVTTTSGGGVIEGKSRFFDDGRRKATLESASGEQRSETVPALESMQDGQSQAGAAPVKEGQVRANPAGGASAFSWLKQGGSRS